MRDVAVKRNGLHLHGMARAWVARQRGRRIAPAVKPRRGGGAGGLIDAIAARPAGPTVGRKTVIRAVRAPHALVADLRLDRRAAYAEALASLVLGWLSSALSAVIARVSCFIWAMQAPRRLLKSDSTPQPGSTPKHSAALRKVVK
jgi:hypothetical protein